MAHIKKLPFAKDIPIIMISSRSAEKHVEHAKSLGAYDFFGKPFDELQLLNTLNGLVRTTIK